MSKSCKFKEHTKFVLTSDGLELFVRYRGPRHGQAVIFISGFDVPSVIWKCTQKFLANKGFFTISSDSRGQGCSGKPAPGPGVYTLARGTQDQREIAQAFCVYNPVVVGYSAGVEVGLSWVTGFPGEVSKLVSVSGSPSELDPIIGATPAQAANLLQLLEGDYTGFINGFAPLLVEGDVCLEKCPKATQKLINKLTVLSAQGSPAALADTVLQAILNPVDFRPLLPQITIPVLAIGGQNDAVIHSNAAIAALLEGIPNIYAVIFPGKSHSLIFTLTCEFNETLFQFLTNTTKCQICDFKVTTCKTEPNTCKTELVKISKEHLDLAKKMLNRSPQ